MIFLFPFRAYPTSLDNLQNCGVSPLIIISGSPMSNKFAILRVGKLKSAVAIKGMLKHNFRDIETPNAAGELLDENIHISAKSTDEGMAMYRDILPDKVRKNAVHAIDYLITTSPDATPEANAGAIKEAVEWVTEKHGAENIIMASVHRDESTPHVHMLVVPMKDGKLNARHFIGGTKHRMSELQDEFYERIEKQGLDLDRGVKGSKATHKDISKHYSEVNQIVKKRKEIENKGAVSAGKLLQNGLNSLSEQSPEVKVKVIEKVIGDLVNAGLKRPEPLKAQEVDMD